MRGFTLDEQRRVLLARERARKAMFARMSGAPAGHVDHKASGRRRRRLLTSTMVVMLLSVAFAAYQFVDVRPPTALVEALLPRL